MPSPDPFWSYSIMIISLHYTQALPPHISTKVDWSRELNDCLPASTASPLEVRVGKREMRWKGERTEREWGKERAREQWQCFFTQSPNRSRLRPLFLLQKSFVGSWQSCRRKTLSENKEECVFVQERACHCKCVCTSEAKIACVSLRNYFCDCEGNV